MLGEGIESQSSAHFYLPIDPPLSGFSIGIEPTIEQHKVRTVTLKSMLPVVRAHPEMRLYVVNSQR